jgi:uncharacterized protein
LSRLLVRLTPSGGADRIDGAGRDGEGRAYLKVRVRAPPEDGKANAALEKLIAKTLGVAKTKVSVVRGTTARLKALEVEGVSEAEMAAFMAHYGEAT